MLVCDAKAASTEEVGFRFRPADVVCGVQPERIDPPRSATRTAPHSGTRPRSESSAKVEKRGCRWKCGRPLTVVDKAPSEAE